MTGVQIHWPEKHATLERMRAESVARASSRVAFVIVGATEIETSELPGNARIFNCSDHAHAESIANAISSAYPARVGVNALPEPTFKAKLPTPSLAAITCFYNPAGFKSLRSNYDRFASQFDHPSWPPLFTVEIALPGQRFSIPKGDRVLRLRAKHALWFKECALNIVARTFVPEEFGAIAWLDCDLIFENQEWPAMTCERLRDIPAVQLFDEITHLDRAGDPVRTRRGVVAQLKTLSSIPEIFGDYSPGGAWAAHREFFDRFGLYERFITGGGDAMAHSAMMTHLDPPYLRGFENDALAADFRQWALPVARHVRGDVDCVPGHVTHLWHGDRDNRQYRERRYYLAGFDPVADLRSNSKTGLLEWATDKPELHSRHVEYFKARKEDG